MEDNKVRKIAISVVKLIFVEGVFLYLFNYLLDVIGLKNIVSTFFHSKKILSFLSYPIPLWEVIVSFIVFIILILTFNFYRTKINSRPIKTRQEKIYDLIEEFKLKYKYMEGDFLNGIEYRTHLSLRDDNVYLDTIEPYCIIHQPNQPRLKMMYQDDEGYGEPTFVCPDPECGIKSYDLDRVKIILQSKLDDEWDRSLKEIN
ncbi:MAG: hypothetical protein QM743_13365 [Chitinophagaceae bacterium]